MELFRLDPARALASIELPGGALWAVNAYSDADELDSLAGEALAAGVIARGDPSAHIAIYPKSLSEPDPILAISLGAGPQLLGYPLRLREREGEDPIAFTLRLLDEIVVEATRLAASAAPSGLRPYP